MDLIEIKDLECFSHHGLLEEEHALGQKFMVSLKLFLDLRKSGRNDDIHESLDYSEVAHFIHDFMSNKRFQLIEALAENIANELLLHYERLQKVEVCVKKPWAPILLPLDTVSVTVCRGWHPVFLGAGSNIEPKSAYLERAFKELSACTWIRNLQSSEWITTKPYGVKDQDDFLNGVFRMETLYTPEELLEKLHEIEAKEHRERTVHWGPRTLDLDILFYEDWIVQRPDLVIPHPDLCNRDFVLKPMVELAPYWIHPVLKKSMMQLLQEFETK